ncbi:hypothetical protein GOM49_03515 [Clostridium bovifaecis]|uniref:Uncharacterized protein n=1 Tax=Clostridium bovifaecis TaxID=2184719 RepID=A0A6I6EVW4_9CLOT|nr:hypothetical protein GOM49_03515 [Clostridium bovifaecis]
MITTINLSLPRKKLLEEFDKVLFKARMMDIDINRYAKTTLGAIFICAFRNTNANAKELYNSKDIIKQSTEVLRLIGYPTIDLIYQLLSMKQHLKIRNLLNSDI